MNILRTHMPGQGFFLQKHILQSRKQDGNNVSKFSSRLCYMNVNSQQGKAFASPPRCGGYLSKLTIHERWSIYAFAV